FVAVRSQRKRAPLSFRKNSLARPMCQMLTPGPMMVPFDAEPNCPLAGGANAVVSNHWLMLFPLARLGFFRRFGRMVTSGGSLVVYAIPTGSGPVQKGVRKYPVCVVKTPATSQPPTARFSTFEDPDRKWRPRPNGS